MGRQGPRLVPFLKSGMINKKYRNLIPEDASGLIFSIVLPHKTKKLEPDDEFIFKDWYTLNGKKYVFHSKHYTDAKQAITASLRKSDYVDKIHISDHRLTYKILSKAEVEEKKRLKKEQKKLNEIKNEAHDSDDALSIESGYDSGVNSPQNSYIQALSNDTIITPSDNESGSGREVNSLQNDYNQVSLNDGLIPPIDYKSSSPISDTIESITLFGENGAMQSALSDTFDGFLKPKSMNASIPAENSLTAPILYEAEVFTNIQTFAENFKSVDYFPENDDNSTRSFDLMDCFSDTAEYYNPGFVEPLPFEKEKEIFHKDSVYEEPNNTLFDDGAFYPDSPFVCKDSICNQSSETQNEFGLSSEPENILTVDFWNKLIEDISDIDFYSSMAFEENSQEQILTSPDAGLSYHKTEVENLYLCKKCFHLGKTPILFCEPQFKKTSTEKFDGLKIAFDEAILKEINGFKCVKEYKFINDHLMVILEPNDD